MGTDGGRHPETAGESPRPPHRLRPWVVALSSTTAVIVLAVIVWQAHVAVRVLAKEQFLEQEMLTARQTARGIEGALARLVREMELLAEVPAVRDLEVAPARRAMERTLGRVAELAVNDISRSDARGVVRLTLTSPELVGQDFSFRDYFRQVREQPPGVPVFEFLTFRGFRKGQKGILIALPVRGADGSFAGPLVFVVEVGNLLARHLPPPGPGARSWVVDRRGTVLAHGALPVGAELAAVAGTAPGARELAARVGEGSEFRGEYVGPAGVPVVAAATPIRVGGEVWSVAVEYDAARVDEGIAAFTRRLAAGSLLAVLVIVGGAVLLLRQSGRWNAALREEIAERRRAERELRHRERSYRTLVESSPS